MKVAKVVEVKDLDDGTDEYICSGYRIDMILPSDAPRELLLTRGENRVLLRSKNRIHSVNADWVTGRAGMQYRDLLPGRLQGRVVASAIRLTSGGDVQDYVHYHKIDVQVIYCKKGRIKVVYEDQGEPFWLEPGDLVLQPPEIRHRVLECTAGAEVIEVTSPAEHETWVDHYLELPNDNVDRERLFSGQRFYRHVHGRADARNDLEKRLVTLADMLFAAQTGEKVYAVVATFSQSLCQT